VKTAPVGSGSERHRRQHLVAPHSNDQRAESPAARYEALKRELVRTHPQDRLAYIAGKERYLSDLEARALAWARRGPA
jgi:GrpB-like predicted nucleotidyltransferase (UPF0157 family)